VFSKELRRLSRRELVDVIYQLKKNEQEMQEKIQQMEQALEDKRIRLSVAGSIAEATASVTNIFAAAQNTADLYLHEISCMKAETQLQCTQILEEAKQQAEKILEESRMHHDEMMLSYQKDYRKYQQLQDEIRQLEAQKNKD
jgi:hypothetical protein